MSSTSIVFRFTGISASPCAGTCAWWWKCGAQLACNAALAVAVMASGCERSSPNATNRISEARASTLEPGGAVGHETERQVDANETLGHHVRASLARAIEAIVREDKLQVSEIWGLRKALERFPHDELQRYVDAQAASTAATSFVGLVRSAPPPQLPEDPGRGLQRMSNFLLACLGDPEERAQNFLRQYLTERATGYVLTHQLLALEWCKQMGRSLPEDLSARREDYLDRIAKEHNRDVVFSDLYAERAAILLAFGSPNRAEADRWIRIILDAQQADGSWGALSWIAEYDGQVLNVQGHGTRMHTAGLATLALAAYVDRFHSGKQGGPEDN